MRPRGYLVLGMAALAIVVTPTGGVAGEGGLGDPSLPWPAKIVDFKPVAPGEHPRLLFRKSDIPKLREKAKTPEGQVILKHLRRALYGSEDETAVKATPASKWCMSTVAGWGFLYVITGEKRYADLAREAQEMAYSGAKDCFDDRYSFSQPDGALRAGPSIGYGTLGYDLCYEAWDEEYRQKFAKYIANYNSGANKSLAELARGSRHHPGSNHWGLQVGGATLALLGIMGDPGVDMAKVQPLIDTNRLAMIRNMTEGFGDGGQFPEGNGEGSMSSHIVFFPALQAWKVAYGLDYYTPRQNAQWMAMKWFFLTVPFPGMPGMRQGFWPERCGIQGRVGYNHNIWSGMHAYFSHSFGVVPDDQKAAMLWFYNLDPVRAVYEKSGSLYDTSDFPHVCVMSFVNWPVGMKPKNPGGVLPHAYRDTKWGFYAWRNRWKDENDSVVSILTGLWYPDFGIPVRTQGQRIEWRKKAVTWGNEKKPGTGLRFTDEFTPAKDGSTVMMCNDGASLAIDFSGASGLDLMLVMTDQPPKGDGESAEVPKDDEPPALTTTTEQATEDGVAVEAFGRKFYFLLVGKSAPTPKVEGKKIVVGKQTVALEKGRIVLGVFGSAGN